VLAAADITCSMAWSVWLRARGTLWASSRANFRNPISTASSARSIVRTWRTSASVNKSTGMSIPRLLQQLFQAIQSAVELLAAGSERQPNIPLGAEGGTRHQVHMRRFQGRLAEGCRIDHLLASQRAPE